MILVTGGAGFIGSNFVKDWVALTNERILNLDALTYAGNLENLASLESNPQYVFVHGDVGDRLLLEQLLAAHRPRAIIHFAAESHVDRSIYGPDAFVETNIKGTFQLLEAAREYWESLDTKCQQEFRFLHVSTDEVYGSLASDAPTSVEEDSYLPNSPYAASKAASDHLVRAWYHTYGMPVLTTHCSNNYGPYQFPEKLIPLVILNALSEKPLPLYGDGLNVRDWLYVTDHCAAIRIVLSRGEPGETYNIGGWNEMTNLEVVTAICRRLDVVKPSLKGSYERLIAFVKDRPGHDRRYALNASKIEARLGWKPVETFQSGIKKTVDWYLQNTAWVDNVVCGRYKHWVAKHYKQAE